MTIEQFETIDKYLGGILAFSILCWLILTFIGLMLFFTLYDKEKKEEREKIRNEVRKEVIQELNSK